MRVVYFKSEDEGDGTYDGQIGRAYLHLDDGSTGDEGRDLGFITLGQAAKIAIERDAELDVDGPTAAQWESRHDGRSSPASSGGRYELRPPPDPQERRRPR